MKQTIEIIKLCEIYQREKLKFNKVRFFSKDILFIIELIKFNFIILKLKFNFSWKTRKERKSDPVATKSERPPATQLNLMSFVKIQSGQTKEIQWSPLSMLSLEMHLPWAHNSALLLYILGLGTFHDTLTANKHLPGPKLIVWHCDKLSETLKTWKANSHLPSHCPPHLRANSQHFQVPNCPGLNYRVR